MGFLRLVSPSGHFLSHLAWLGLSCMDGWKSSGGALKPPSIHPSWIPAMVPGGLKKPLMLGPPTH